VGRAGVAVGAAFEVLVGFADFFGATTFLAVGALTVFIGDADLAGAGGSTLGAVATT